MSYIKLFESKKIRSEWNEAEQKWYFAIIDVIEVLTESNNARRYWSDLKRKLNTEGFSQLYEIIVQLKMVSSDGKKYITDCADAKGLLRIIQSIPSPNAEPFKQWLAQVGSDRLDEIENPELATQRTRELYKLKGYPDLCYSSNENDWKNVLKEYKIKGDHYLLASDQFSYFSKMFDINSAPRYILINKMGLIVNSNFRPPMEPNGYLSALKNNLMK